jgi:hypothetical protein
VAAGNAGAPPVRGDAPSGEDVRAIEQALLATGAASLDLAHTLEATFGPEAAWPLAKSHLTDHVRRVCAHSGPWPEVTCMDLTKAMGQIRAACPGMFERLLPTLEGLHSRGMNLQMADTHTLLAGGFHPSVQFDTLTVKDAITHILGFPPAKLPHAFKAKSLSLYNCDGPILELPVGLQVGTLTILDCPKFTTLPQGLRVTETLTIKNCPNWDGQVDPAAVLGLFTSDRLPSLDAAAWAVGNLKLQAPKDLRARAEEFRRAAAFLETIAANVEAGDPIQVPNPFSLGFGRSIQP